MFWTPRVFLNKYVTDNWQDQNTHQSSNESWQEEWTVREKKNLIRKHQLSTCLTCKARRKITKITIFFQWNHELQFHLSKLLSPMLSLYEGKLNGYDCATNLGVHFLSRRVYNRVRTYTSGRGLPAKNYRKISRTWDLQTMLYVEWYIPHLRSMEFPNWIIKFNTCPTYKIQTLPLTGHTQEFKTKLFALQRFRYLSN